jgi:hypothetical protein
LKEYLDNYLPIVADPHNIKNMRRVHEKNYKLKSNWKLYVEVDMETLHTPYIHKKFYWGSACRAISGKRRVDRSI